MSIGSRSDAACANNWRFSRVGGFDQVCLDSGNDVLHLDRLDQKLWAALSCPTHGLEFDEKTLRLIDSDGDGRIRAPELIAAVQWAASALKNPDDLLKGENFLPLAAINDATPEGQEILAAAKRVLTNLGKAESTVVTVEDAADTVKIFAETRFNGDGVVPAYAAEDEAVRAVVEEIMACIGSEPDRSGAPGVSVEKLELFFKSCRDFTTWWSDAEKEQDRALSVFMNSGGEPAAAFLAVRAKVDDFFLRCSLAEYDASAVEALNPSAEEYRTAASNGAGDSRDFLAKFPISRIEAGASLPLSASVNPAWAEAVAGLRAKVVAPVLGEKDALTAAEWEALTGAFKSYEAWMGRKQGAEVEKLGAARVRELLSGGFEEAIAALIAKDKELEPEAKGIASVDRLVHYYRDLHRLLNNFVCFHDFYRPGSDAVFQAGDLYLDGRCCRLCIKVEDVAKHSALAALGGIYLAYCECTRQGEKTSIAAAFTEGDSDNLLVGRNGVFYDRKGRDWDAVITKIVEHPISIRQAFWSPYKRFGRMVGEQIEKMAAAHDKDVQTSAATGATSLGAKAEAGKPAPEQAPFDVGKFAGIFAAIGLAVGAIGTAIASLVTGFLGLQWWQMPLVIPGFVLVISGPSMVLAYLKLRKRNLAPILDACGWAVNARAIINIPFGASLTEAARLPDGSRRTLMDPYAEKEGPWKAWLVLFLLAALVLVLWLQGYLAAWWKLIG